VYRATDTNLKRPVAIKVLPDNQWLAFFSDGGLKRLAIGGGVAEPITPAIGTERAFGGTWGADGTIVISLGGRLLQASAKGGPIQPLAEPDAARGEVRFAWPEFLPDGRSLLFTILGADGDANPRIAVLDLATRRTTNVLQGGHAARYLRTGHLLYASQGRLHVVAFDVPLWGRAGSNELFYWDLKGKFKVVSVTTTDDFRVGPSQDVPIGDGWCGPSSVPRGCMPCPRWTDGS
jgi:hypothetical protein